jgi:hypothetical protein
VDIPVTDAIKSSELGKNNGVGRCAEDAVRRTLCGGRCAEDGSKGRAL